MKNALAMKQRTDLVSFEAPSYIKPGHDGLENVRQQDSVLPRAVLLQPLSPSVVAKQTDRHVPGAVVNSLNGEVIITPDEEINFVPILHFVQWIRWGDRDMDEGILDSSIDPQSELAISSQRRQMRALTGGKQVFDVTEYHNFIVGFPSLGPSRMVVIPCCRSSHKKGRMLLGLAKFRGSYPLYAGMYTLSTKVEMNRRSQSYHVFDFKNAGWCPEDMYESIAKLYADLKAMQVISYDLKGEQEEVTDEISTDSEI